VKRSSSISNIYAKIWFYPDKYGAREGDLRLAIENGGYLRKKVGNSQLRQKSSAKKPVADTDREIDDFAKLSA